MKFEIIGPPPRNAEKGISWPKLTRATLIRRYKRFLADASLANGMTVTAHCPNSGSMKGCSEPGRTIYLSKSDRPGRKLPYTWEMIEMPPSLVGVNTLIPNRLVAKAVLDSEIPLLEGYETLAREVKFGHDSRIDLALYSGGQIKCFVEIKNCTLIENGAALFPDAVTTRGLKHLVELQNALGQGFRAVIFFLIQRMDSKVFRPADHIDEAYGGELRTAIQRGVEPLAYDVILSRERIFLNKSVPIDISPQKRLAYPVSP